jgi:hypothetical protein
MQRTITGPNGQVRARLDEGGNTMLFVYDRGGRPLGYYNQTLDKTFDRGGRYIGPGDQRMYLVEEE